MEDMLGFGVAEVGMMVTPVALVVTSDVVRFVWAEATKAAGTGAGAAVQSLVIEFFARVRAQIGMRGTKRQSPTTTRGEAPRWSPTAQRLTQIREIARERAKRMKLSPTQADRLADAIVGRLAVASV